MNIEEAAQIVYPLHNFNRLARPETEQIRRSTRFGSAIVACRKCDGRGTLDCLSACQACAGFGKVNVKVTASGFPIWDDEA